MWTDLWSVEQDEMSDEAEQNNRNSNSVPKSLREADTFKKVQQITVVEILNLKPPSVAPHNSLNYSLLEEMLNRT